MVVCQKWYELHTSSLSWQEGEIQNYPTPCKPETLPDDRQAQQIILDQLKADGFDISTNVQAVLSKKPIQAISP